MRGKWILIAGILILAAVAVGALSLLRQRSRPAAPAAPVSSPAKDYADLTGRIQAREVVSVPVPIDGTIEAFFADVGQSVTEGQLLAQISNSDLVSERDAALSALQKAQANVSSIESRQIAARMEASRARTDASRARAEFEREDKRYVRQQSLFREGAASRVSLDRVQEARDSSQAEFQTLDEMARLSDQRVSAGMKELEEAKRIAADKSREYEEVGNALAAAQVTSPVDGLIVGRKGQTGQQVGIEIEDLFQIAVNLSALDVVVDPDPSILPKMQPGLAVDIQIAEAPGGIPGEVRMVKDNRAIIGFTSPTPVIRPGMTAHIRFKLR